jgi:hypothetical protein
MTAWSHLTNVQYIDRVLESVKSHPEIWDEAWVAFKDATRLAARDVVRDAALYAALGTVAALTAYDDASKYLDMPSDKLHVYAILSEDPAAVLLLPAVIAFERIRELESV